MKNKKLLWVGLAVLLLICLALVYFFRPMTMNDIYSEPNFTGVVTEVFDKAIIVSVNEGEDELKSSNKMSVSLDVKLKDSMTDFDIGDKVKVFYDGTIAYSYPAQIDTVYAILLVSAEEKSSYQITHYSKDGAVISDTALTDEKLAESIIMDVLMKSAAWQGVDVDTLEEYYLIERTVAATEETSAYYAYLLEDGKAVLQSESNGTYSYLSQGLYEALDTIYLDLKE